MPDSERWLRRIPAQLAVRAMGLGEGMGGAMGARVVDAMAKLTPYMQLALERAGYQLLGIAPGYDWALVSPGIARLVDEAVYA